MKTKRINVRVTEQEKDVLTQAALSSGLPESIIVREAVREKIAQLKEKIKPSSKLALPA